MPVAGCFRALILHDVAEAVRLDKLRSILGIASAERAPSFTHRTPDYVRFEQPPVVDAMEPSLLETGERLQATAKYYDYGVISLELELHFECEWDILVEKSSGWISTPAIESRAQELIGRAVQRARPALVKAYESWLTEDYYIIQLNCVPDSQGKPMQAAELLAHHGSQIAQLIRGESMPLSEAECREVLQSSISYYPADLLVAGWTAAVVYDTPEGAAPTIQLLEYANTQLLEYRHYDNLLTRVLETVYGSMQNGSGFFSRWRMARGAERLNTIRLEVIELTERTDNSIKFLSDMFYARLYRVAAARVGVPDYRNLVDDKLRTASELYEFMVDQFNQGRAVVLELVVVFILIVEIVLLLFWGKVT
jgi:hypothetical protein